MPAGQATSQLVVRSSCARHMAPDFLNNKGNHNEYTKLLF